MTTPKRSGKRIGGLVLLMVLLALAFGFWQQQQGSEDNRTRQKLDQLLAQPRELPDSRTPQAGQNSTLPRNQRGWLEGWLEDSLTSLPQTLMQMGGLDVTETPQAYILRFPLDSDSRDERVQEAGQIEVHVYPRRIEVSGRHAVGQHGSSSFYQSFSTTSEVSSQNMERRITDDELIVTIPKAQPGSPTPPPDGTPNPSTQAERSPTLNRNALQDILEQEGQSI